MSATAKQALRPDVELRRLAPPDSLAGRLLARGEPVALPRPGAPRPPERGPARLEADAFGASSAAARARLEAILSGEGLCVTTGHQPILFTGPLYVLYKALTAIALAERLEAAWNLPVLPVFWIASDDHDWEEVARATLLDLESRPVTLRLTPTEAWAGRPVGSAPLGPEIDARIDEVSEILPSSEFTPLYLDHLRDSYREGRSYGEAFAELLSRLLEGRDYAWLDAARPEVKRAAAPWFGEILADSGRYLAASREGAAALREAGEEPPIPVLEGGLPLFFDTGERRERLYAAEAGASAGRDGRPEPLETWQERLAERPDAFSPNVASRPALESRLLPVCATVLGPGETAYWSQLPPLFAAAGAPFPAIQPRGAWTLIEPRIRKLLERFELEVGELEDGGDAVIEGLTAAARPEDVEETLGGLRAAIGRGLGAVEGAVDAELPGIKSAVGKTRKALFDAVTELERQIDQETRRRLDIQIGQVRRLAANLFPERRAQERTLSPLYYLARYGSGVVDDVERATRRWLDGSLAASGTDG